LCVEAGIRRRDVDGGHCLPWQGPARTPQSRANGAADPGCGFCVCRRGAARERINLAAVSRRKGRGHARDSSKRVRAETAAHRRSEEHTSELQSPDHLVCRLLLEKKKI